MKKTFSLEHPRTKPARLADGYRNEVKRYLKRERGKMLPEGFDVWVFDCKFGATVDEAKVIAVEDIGASITSIETQGLKSFYLEILARASLKAEI
ncbi:MAG: hypothetical protein AUK35_10405 [Zetaproteobacteria bacterium CG2_30_46_52]|nr:MAG: hypothetical protein AUK35_10405 [Zetaproteobacteria bacterium CG2_30_46_52]